jgi:uncharacterized protein YwqG
MFRLNMTLDHLIAMARTHGFVDVDAVKRLARPAVVLRPGGGGAAKSIMSRLGGLPDLPRSIPWPKRDGRSLAFIAQIELSSQPSVAAQDGFPREGLLLFFYDAEQSTWGFDPKDTGSFAVVHVPESTPATDLDDWPDDLPECARYRACSLASEETIALPPWESILVEDLKLDREQLDAYQSLLEVTTKEDTWASRSLLGGYPDQIQGDMMLECALVSAGLYCGDSTAYHDPRIPTFREEARNWRLLLQVPSAEPAGMMWGDVGCLYFWIRDNDLRAGRFERTWMILQCG